MQARIVSASRGAFWLAEGWRLFRVAPVGWLSVVFVYLLGTQVLALVPVVGVLVALIAVPGLSVGMMGAARAASRNAAPRIAMLVEPFRIAPRPQLLLGGVYLACSVLIFAAMSLADGEGALRAALSGGSPAEVETADWLAAAAAFAALYAPVMMMFWFAPVLAAWHATGAAKSLFFSFFACLMNWRAFLAYGALVAFVMAVVPLLALVLPLALFGADHTKLAPLLLPLLLLMLPTLFASFYASYRDIFGGDE